MINDLYITKRFNKLIFRFQAHLMECSFIFVISVHNIRCLNYECCFGLEKNV